MKKVLMFALSISMIICPMACINDPTTSDALCKAQETDTSADCTDVVTETSTDEFVLTDEEKTEIEQVVDQISSTDTETVVE